MIIMKLIKNHCQVMALFQNTISVSSIPTHILCASVKTYTTTLRQMLQTWII